MTGPSSRTATPTASSSPSLSPGGVLVVDDDRDVLTTAELVLKQRFQPVQCIANPHDIPALLQQGRTGVVLLDMNFSRGDISGAEGIYWLKQIRQLSPDTQVVMSTAYAEIDLAVRAVKEGAADFVVKPWENEKLIATLQNCLRLSASHRQVKQLQSRQQALNAELSGAAEEMIGAGRAFLQVMELVDRVAESDANVLILGENGTGKELVARAIHRRSRRAQNSMITVDAGAVPPSLFEAEMFGHVKGAFTDAREDRIGKFEMACGGTLFLDEIGNLDVAAQSKLLRVLESRSIYRVGGTESIPLDIRLICATNLTAKQLADQQQFRCDLLYRINTVEIPLPPLRERREDIPLLARHFAAAFAGKYRRPTPEVPDTTLKLLCEYPWPGNIRELKHAIERALLMSRDNTLSPDAFLLRPAARPHEPDELTLEDLERTAIMKALERHQGNLTQAAKALGLGRTTLYRKLGKYGLAD
ncbi:MAG: sigma-54 dependent transcriptional regulator [Pseudomonadales bacterium]|nr:sigma-54 dependent transcriptional regulator [Pseudomonadales bacterium]